MDASVWFIRRGRHFATFPLATHVLVEPVETGDALLSVRRMIDQVNWCTRGDAIVVLIGDHPTRLQDVPGPSDDDLRTTTEASRW